MEAIAGSNPLEFGVVGLALLVIWKLLDVGKALFLAKRVEPAVAGQILACQQDPRHYQRIAEIHSITKANQERISHGEFSCQWKDRDEVRDFMEAMRAQTSASKAQTHAINALTTELRITRGGTP